MNEEGTRAGELGTKESHSETYKGLFKSDVQKHKKVDLRVQEDREWSFLCAVCVLCVWGPEFVPVYVNVNVNLRTVYLVCVVLMASLQQEVEQTEPPAKNNSSKSTYIEAIFHLGHTHGDLGGWFISWG